MEATIPRTMLSTDAPALCPGGDVAGAAAAEESCATAPLDDSRLEQPSVIVAAAISTVASELAFMGKSSIVLIQIFFGSRDDSRHAPSWIRLAFA
jgi:hypothetical protein